MKVVLFCGGLGMRLRDYSELIPKPMAPIGYRPVLWHVMKYYAKHGYKDFILCLGYRADVIKKYFLEYQEGVSNDFVMENGGRDVRLLHSDIADWRITFVDTGLNSSIAERLIRVRSHLEGEETFLANYSDGLTDFPIPDLVREHEAGGAIASLLCVRPPFPFHVVKASGSGLVSRITRTSQADLWINGGYFVFNRKIFDYIGDKEELVEEPFHRLIAESKLLAHKHTGFWGCMDTYKERQKLEDLYSSGNAPWAVE